jgi:glycosyltransferase involved in cell wall biosynthesis
MQVNLPSYNSGRTDIICFSLSRWDAEISSPAVSLAKELAKNNRVFFIGHPYSYKDIFFGKGQRAKGKRQPSIVNRRQKNIFLIHSGTVLPINFLPEGKIYNFFSSINNSVVLKTLRKTIAENNIHNYIFINFFDPFFLQSIPDDIKPNKYVYQCMDDMSQVPYTSRHGVRLENEIIRRADVVLCTSRELTKVKSAYSDRIHFHPNAADFELFNKAAGETLNRPADLPLNKKIIGFTGSIEYRADTELIKKAAAAHADKILFFVGPVDLQEAEINQLKAFSNIYFAGARDIAELPAYLQYFDCCIIPYKVNALTASIYPLKINEYLAAGKPVVATNFSEDISSFRDCAYIASDHEEFIRFIDEAIDGNGAEKRKSRIEKASVNSWRNRVEELWKLLI